MDTQSKPDALPRSALHWIVLLISFGLLLRVVLAFATYGETFDMESLRIVADRMREDPLRLYETGRWPYAPLYAPWTLVALGLSSLTPLPFHGWVQLLPIAADGALAALVARWMWSKGHRPAAVIGAAATIAIGPVFVMISGYHGQLDSLAILPAVIACVLWDRDIRRRALLCGLLIGLGAGLKTFPLLLVVALLPTARSWREVAKVSAAAVSVPAVALLPFLAVTPRAVEAIALNYGGWPGAGGVSTLVQPSLVDGWLLGADSWMPNRLSLILWDWNTLTVGLALLALLVLLRRRRVPAVAAGLGVWLVFLTVSYTFFPQYLVWLLPFVALAARLRLSVVVQLVALTPAVLLYMRTWDNPGIVPVYVFFAGLLWLVILVVATHWLWTTRGGTAPSATAAPPSGEAIATGRVG